MPVQAIESWRATFRNGFAPIIGTETLGQLLVMLESDDDRLIQGQTTAPPPLMCVADWPCEKGCFLSAVGAIENGGFGHYADGKKNPDPARVGTCEEVFARLCFDADTRIGEPASCRWFLNWFDDTPRDEMRRELAAEIRRELHNRKESTDAERA